jgi:hypothetical protein
MSKPVGEAGMRKYTGTSSSEGGLAKKYDDGGGSGSSSKRAYNQLYT